MKAIIHKKGYGKRKFIIERLNYLFEKISTKDLFDIYILLLSSFEKEED